MKNELQIPSDGMQQKQTLSRLHFEYAIIRSAFMIIWEYCGVALAVFMKSALWEKIVDVYVLTTFYDKHFSMPQEQWRFIDIRSKYILHCALYLIFRCVKSWWCVIIIIIIKHLCLQCNRLRRSFDLCYFFFLIRRHTNCKLICLDSWS